MPKQISSLTMNGKPMWGAPDLVLRERKSGRILIIERKASNKDVPSDGWPNLRAQLWAYSQIDDWLDAPEKILAAEIWGFGRIQGVRRRSVILFDVNDQGFNSEASQLFSIYAGGRDLRQRSGFTLPG